MKIKALAFDIDGTLYANSRMYIHSLPSFLFHPRLVYHFGKVRKEIRRTNHDGAFRDVQVKLLARSMNIPREKAEHLMERNLYTLWERSFQGVKPLPGVRDALLFFKNRGIALGALSDFPVQKKLVYLGLADLMDFAFCSEETGYLKPHEAPFLSLIHRFNLLPENILYVGNNYAYDIEGASKVGLKTAFYTRKVDQKGVADFAFSRYEDLRRWVEERLN